MERNEIEEVICKIMVHDGPDRHVDGYEVITDFIMALLQDSAEPYVWKAKYYEKKGIVDDDDEW